MDNDILNGQAMRPDMTDVTGDAGQAVGVLQLRAANEVLTRYREGKANLEDRIVDEEKWYEMRMDVKARRARRYAEISEDGYEDSAATRAVRKARRLEEDRVGAATASQWMFSAIANKHADAMDNIPTAAILPREQTDEGDAKMLSDIVPVILTRANWQRVYSRGEWYKLKHGMCAYGVWWDPKLENGLGDIRISNVNILNLYWDPAVDDIQESANIFILALEDRKKVQQMYPGADLDDTKAGRSEDWKQFVHEDSADDSRADKIIVVDWYYKVYRPDGRTVLQYVKYAGETLLYASENSPQYAEAGWYGHGQYPVQIDTLFPIEGTATGFGLIAISRAPQEYIDLLDRNILGYAERASHYKVMCKSATDMNIAQFLDPSREVVEVSGEVSDDRVRQFTMAPLDSMYINLRDGKINELKETTSNRDVSQGSSSGGVTAASAIAALQEAGNKTSRDMLASSYHTFELMMQQVVELIRQFYDDARSFRITGEGGTGNQYVMYDNSRIRDAQTGVDSQGNPLYRRAVFDINVKAAKQNPYNQLSHNETMKELYSMGVFAPENASQALAMLKGMEFDGIDQVRQTVEENATVYAQLQAAVQWIAQVTGTDPVQILAVLQGQAAPMSQPMAVHGAGGGGQDALLSAQEGGRKAAMTSYGQELAQRARADATRKGEGASPS